MTEKCLCGDPNCRIMGYCHCECGKKTTVAAVNDASKGWVKGQPTLYIRGHGRVARKDLHALTEIDVQNRRAMCSRCGLVTIAKKSKSKVGWRCTGQLSTAHRLYDIDTEKRTAWCLGCCAQTEIHFLAHRDQWVCAPGYRAHRRAGRIKTRGRDLPVMREYSRKNGRANNLRQRYGLTEAEYDAKVTAQNGLCAICQGPPSGNHGRLVVDHCHDTGATRGLLCNRCNLVLGNIEENPDILQSLIDYLQHWKSLELSTL